MKRRYAGALVLAAALISCFLGSATAFAEVTLPELTVDAFVTATFGKGKLSASGAEIKSENGIIDGSEEINKKSGKAVIWMLKATLLGGNCNSKGATAGNILIPVTWDLVPLGQTVLVALLIEKSVVVECTALGTKVELLAGSDVLGEISPGDTTTTKFRVEINAPEKKQAFTEFENDEAKKVKAELKVKINGGATTAAITEFETATLTTREGKEESNKELETEVKAVPPETQKISLKPIQLGGKCPELGLAVWLSVEKETCEFRLENENAFERIEVTGVRLAREAQCNGLLSWCLVKRGSESTPECTEGTIWGTSLAPGGVCYIKLEYNWKIPTPPGYESLEVKTKSTLGAVTTLIKTILLT